MRNKLINTPKLLMSITGLGVILFCSSCCGRQMIRGKDTGLINRAYVESCTLWGNNYSCFLIGNPIPPTREELRRMEKLLQESKDPNHKLYFILLLLKENRKDSLCVSKAKEAAILCDALAWLNDVSDFGNISSSGCSDALAGRILREAGRDALPYFLPLLENQKEAGRTGSADATIASVQRIRKCDYAYRYACLALGETYSFSLTVSGRDEKIEAIKHKIKKTLSGADNMKGNNLSPEAQGSSTNSPSKD